MSAIDTLAHEYGWSEKKILNMTIAKIRGFLEASQARRKGEFRRQIALQEWSTRLIAMAALPAEAKDETRTAIGKETFPWYEDQEEAKAVQYAEDDLSFLETGDVTAAAKNEGKTLPSFAR